MIIMMIETRYKSSSSLSLSSSSSSSSYHHHHHHYHHHKLHLPCPTTKEITDFGWKRHFGEVSVSCLPDAADLGVIHHLGVGWGGCTTLKVGGICVLPSFSGFLFSLRTLQRNYFSCLLWFVDWNDLSLLQWFQFCLRKNSSMYVRL